MNSFTGKETRPEDLLGASFDCACGRRHSTAFSRLILGEGALGKIPVLLAELGKQRPYLICDGHTLEAAGREVFRILSEAGVSFEKIVLPVPEKGDLPADETAFGRVAMSFPPDCDIVCAVGTGTINDLSRYISFLTGRPFILIVTAPSMDGMVSGGAPLIRDNLKITFPAHAPVALVADLKVLCAAPLNMLAAGAGDILGKYNCLADWKLSALVNGEYYCPELEGLVRQAIEKTRLAAGGLSARDPEAVRTLTEALILAGMAMDFSGNSRPASGAEHHISHFFEMQFLFDGIPAVLHGTKVGIGTVLMLRLYNELARMEKPDFAALRAGIAARPSFDEWAEEMRRVYRPGAAGVIGLEKKAGKNDPEKLQRRLDAIEANWEKIRALAASVPASETAEAFLRGMGAPVRPSEVGVSDSVMEQGILWAKEVRDRYTILQFMWDIGKLPEMKDLLMKEYGSLAR